MPKCLQKAANRLYSYQYAFNLQSRRGGTPSPRPPLWERVASGRVRGNSCHIERQSVLQVWANSKRDRAKALDDYKKSLALGGSRPLPELFAAAGCRFEFSEKTIQPLAKMLNEELKKL